MLSILKEIPITQIKNIKIGHAQDYSHGTGCTVILCENGAPAGVDIRGGGPASRETPLLDASASAKEIHAVLLSGGSAYGLDASGGVMRYLEEKNIGFCVGDIRVPLVCQSCIFDLAVHSSKVRPDSHMAYQACQNAEFLYKNNLVPEQGNIGGGTGATVGKLLGPSHTMKSGIGIYAVELGKLQVAAIVVVNAVGDIFDIETGKQIAGPFDSNKKILRNSEELMYQNYANLSSVSNINTTIGAIITNAHFSKYELNKIASMAHNGYARAIRPVHTLLDGDSIYTLSVGNVVADISLVGTLSSTVMGYAIKNAITHSTTMYGFPSYWDL